MTEDNNTPAPEPAVAPAPAPAPEPAPAPAPEPSPAGDLYKPEGLADHYLGKDDRETIDKLNTAVLGFRKGLSKQGVPENPDGYTLDGLPDDIKTKVLRPGEDGKDPVLEAMKPVLHKHNIPAAAFQELATEFYGVVAGIMDGVNKNEDGTPLADFDYKEHGGMDAAKPLIEGAEVWLNGLAASKKISPKAAAELRGLAGYGEGLSALMELRSAMGNKPIPKNLGGAGQAEITQEAIEQRWADPKSWQPGMIDDAFIEETRAMQRKLDGKAA